MLEVSFYQKGTVSCIVEIDDDCSHIFFTVKHVTHILFSKRKTVTGILTAATAFHCVFQVDYGDHDHVFSNLQKWYRQKWDQILLGQEVTSRPTAGTPSDHIAATNATTKDIPTEKVAGPLNTKRI
jgi:hypothetical protein